MSKEIERVLVVAAHPDDEVLGAGGYIAKLKKEGASIEVLVLSKGENSRGSDDLEERERERLKSLNLSNKRLGVDNYKCLDLPDNAFDSFGILNVVKAILENVEYKTPDLILTHSIKDLNIDHCVTARATLTAFRPSASAPSRILGFYVPSSTDWGEFMGGNFEARYFVELSESDLAAKLEGFSSYKSEIGSLNHPRTSDNLTDLSKIWGRKIGVVYAEAYEVYWIRN